MRSQLKIISGDSCDSRKANWKLHAIHTHTTHPGRTHTHIQTHTNTHVRPGTHWCSVHRYNYHLHKSIQGYLKDLIANSIACCRVSDMAIVHGWVGDKVTDQSSSDLYCKVQAGTWPWKLSCFSGHNAPFTPTGGVHYVTVPLEISDYST